MASEAQSGTGRIVALDLGTKRIGVAVCDEGRAVATPHSTVARVGDRMVEHRLIADVVGEVNAGLLVVGLPLSLDGRTGPAARSVLSEVRSLKRNIGLPVETIDERLTTVTAEEALSAQGVKGHKRKAVVDQVAAAIILQTWLDQTPISEG